MLYIVISSLPLLLESSSSPGYTTNTSLILWLNQHLTFDCGSRPSAHQCRRPWRGRETGPLISVCVPARNEERNIRRCVEALLAQTYPNFEIIVLDDRSTDATGEILRRIAAPRPDIRGRQDDKLRIIDGSDLPPGWAGKPHALTQAAAVARGEWLCFVDADTFVTPDALAAVYAKAARN